MTSSNLPTSFAQNLSRRTALKAAGVGGLGFGALGLGLNFPTTRAVKGHGAAWGEIATGYPIAPYTLTAGALEAFSITERVHVRIDGMGEDIVNLTGMAMFQRSDPMLSPEAEKAGAPLTFATSWIRAEFRTLQAVGTSSLFGRVHVSSSGLSREVANVTPSPMIINALNAGDPTTVQTGNGKGGMAPAGECAALISPQFELQNVGETVHTGGQAVKLGSKVTVVPPVGDVARTLGTYDLFDSKGAVIGKLLAADIEIGPVLHRITTPAATDPSV